VPPQAGFEPRRSGDPCERSEAGHYLVVICRQLDPKQSIPVSCTPGERSRHAQQDRQRPQQAQPRAPRGDLRPSGRGSGGPGSTAQALSRRRRSRRQRGSFRPRHVPGRPDPDARLPRGGDGGRGRGGVRPAARPASADPPAQRAGKGAARQAARAPQADERRPGELGGRRAAGARRTADRGPVASAPAGPGDRRTAARPEPPHAGAAGRGAEARPCGLCGGSGAPGGGARGRSRCGRPEPSARNLGAGGQDRGGGASRRGHPGGGGIADVSTPARRSAGARGEPRAGQPATAAAAGHRPGREPDPFDPALTRRPPTPTASAGR